jgi:DNA polymerase delta subunit 1
MEIVSIEEAGTIGPDEYVYDLETSVGTYLSGDDILVRNTDSAYVAFDIDKGQFTSSLGKFDEVSFMKEQFRISQECADKITKKFKEPIKLEFEKIMYPFFLYEKKRYAYMKWVKPEKPSEELEYKGIAVVRRDYCPYVKEVCETIFEILMKSDRQGSSDAIIKKAVEYLKKIIDDLFTNKVPIEKLIISKSLKDTYKIEGRDVKWYNGFCPVHTQEKEECQICSECALCKKLKKECKECSTEYKYTKFPHVYLAKQMRKLDPANSPKPPDRVDYVFIEKKNAVHQCDQVASPDNIQGNKINTLYYFERQIKEPVMQIMGLMMKNPEKIFEELVLNKTNNMNGQKSIKDYFKLKTQAT